MKKIIIMIFMLAFVSSAFGVSVEMVKSNPAPIVAGDYADITIRFSNLDNTNTLNNVEFGITKTDYILPISSESASINKFLSGEEITKTFRVFFSEELNEGYIELPVYVKHSTSTERQKILVFIQDDLSDAQILVGSISTVPHELLVDTKNNKLKISLQNLGDKDAELVYVTLEPLSEEISAAYAYSLEDSISSIKSGTEGVLEFSVDIGDKVVSSVDAKLNLRYRSKRSVSSNYDIVEKSYDLKIPLTQSPYLVVIDYEQLDNFEIGTTENQLKVTIRNDGLEDANDVRVRIVPDISFPFLIEENTQYVSSKIMSGENATVIFKMEVLESAQMRDYKSAIKLESLVEESRYTREDSVMITPQFGQKTSPFMIGVLIVLGIIIVSIVLGTSAHKKYKLETSSKKSKK